MNRIKGLIITLTIIFSVTIIGCTQNNTNIQPDTNNNKENTSDKNQNTSQDVQDKTENTVSSEDEYRNFLTKNYEKYIKPLDFDKYDDLKEILTHRGEIDNIEFFNEYKTYLEDNKSNLKSFEQTMGNLYLNDAKLKEINDSLVKECKIYVNDLEMQITALGQIDKDVLYKTNNEFILYLDELIDRDDLEKNNFEDKIEETEKLLNLRLEENL